MLRLAEAGFPADQLPVELTATTNVTAFPSRATVLVADINYEKVEKSCKSVQESRRRAVRWEPMENIDRSFVRCSLRMKAMNSRETGLSSPQTEDQTNPANRAMLPRRKGV